jgi:arylsulfatase A-like enzyme
MNIDWAPTIVDFAGASADLAMDGRSLSALVQGLEPQARRRSLLVELPADGTLSSDNRPFAMIRSKDPALTSDAGGQLTLVYAETYDDQGGLTDKEFYDLSTDPLQLESLHTSQEAGRLAQMAALAERLRQLKTCSGAGCQALEN